jgi:hypothetical protein
VKALVKELREARLHASTGANSEAVRHIRATLDLFDAAPWSSVPRDLRSTIARAGRALLRSDVLQAVAAIDEALRAAEKHAAEGE